MPSWGARAAVRLGLSLGCWLGFSAIAGCLKTQTTVSMGTGGGNPGTGGRTGGIGGGTGGSAVPACMGLRCQQTTCAGVSGCKVPACTGGARTTVSGTVYDPAGKVPLYNMKVYVPNATLATLAEGASCLPCDTAASGDPIVSATSDANGHFVLENVPVGDNIPLVVQGGKWRRLSAIPKVTACVDTAISDPNVTRLPRNQDEGNIPKIALTTGGLDALECLLRKIGIEDREFTPETGRGRVNLFAGGLHNGVPIRMIPTANTAGTSSYAPTLNGGAAFTDAETWWGDVANLKPYDIVLHSCDGAEDPTNKGPAALQAFADYANMGGRAFISHFHSYWLERGPAPFPTVAQFNHLGIDNVAMTFMIDQTPGFDKGIALAQWLLNVGASTTLGQLEIKGAKHTVDSVNAGTQQWIYGSTLYQGASSPSVQYFSLATPINVGAGEPRCGKVVFSDLHVSSGSGAATDDDSDPTLPFPTGCKTTALSAQEKALEFMLFDLSACTVPGIP